MSEDNHISESEAEISPAGGPLKIILPPDRSTCTEVKSMLGNKKVSIEHLTEAIALDPVVVIELIKVSNSVNFAPGKTQVTSISNALVALGLDTVSQILDRLLERPTITSTELSETLEEQRARCVETARVARTIARIVSPSLANTAYTTGLLFYVGDMVAVCHLRNKYVEVAKSQGKRSKINYRLGQDFDFHVEDIGVEYLQHTGIPEKLCSSLDRAAVPQSDDSAEVRTICFSAMEMMDAYEAGRWDRFAPGQKIPSSSSIRMLQLSDQKYAQVFEKLSAYFKGESGDSESFTEEEIKDAAAQATSVNNATGAPAPEAPVAEEPKLAPLESEPKITVTEEPPQTQDLSATPPSPATAPGLGRLDSMFGETLSWLKKAKESKTEQKQKEEQAALMVPDAPPSIATQKKQILSGLENLISEAESTEALLTQLLTQLVDCGFFKKSALLVVANDRKSATVRIAAGQSVTKGQTLPIDDPFSPLARACSKVQSTGNKDADVSPFGTKSFALAPIDSTHELPVILYADCGNEAISLAGRRLFRNVVAALNQRLADLPGGIPE